MINRLFRGLAENLDQRREEKIADMGGLEDRMDSPSIPGSFTFPGGFNFLGGGFPNIGGFPNRGGFGQFLTADLPGPVLGPDDFGSYTIPVSDPTYSSGFDYARSIAGGMPMSQVIAPGVSYSPEQPGGYTQEQLNTAPKQSFLQQQFEKIQNAISPRKLTEQEISQISPEELQRIQERVNTIGSPKDFFEKINAGISDEERAKLPSAFNTSGMNFTNLFGMPSVKPPSLEPEEPKRLRPPIGGGRPIPVPPRLIEEPINYIGTGGRIPLPTGPTKAELFAASQEPEEPQRLRPPLLIGLPPAARPTEELIAEGFIPPQEPISVGGVGGISGPTKDIRDLILPPITSIENIAQDPRLANIPTITPPIMPPMDIPVSLPDMLGIPAQTPPIIPPIDMPPMDMPPVDFPPIVELPPIRGIGRPNQNRFSIQQLPRGLF